MDKEIRKKALRQYLKYFRIWFLAVVAVAIGLLGTLVINRKQSMLFRLNVEAPDERVYDYADVLTDKEEEDLRAAIVEAEKQSHADIIIVTLNEPMGISDSDWEWNMMNYADDFYDNRKYGWNKVYGDGALLLDNWYEDADGSQKGSWLSTSGKMEEVIGSREEEKILNAMYEYIDASPYRAYLTTVKYLMLFGRNGADALEDGDASVSSNILIALVFSTFIAICYFGVNVTPAKAKKTTGANTYANDEVPVLRFEADNLIRKEVVSYRIQSDDDENSNRTGSAGNTGGSSSSGSDSVRSSNHGNRGSSNHSNRGSSNRGNGSSSTRSVGSADRSSVSNNTRGGGSYGHHISGGRRTESGGSSGSTARSGGSGSGGHSHGGGGRRR